MRRVFRAAQPGIGTKLTVGFGILVGLTLVVVALAFVAGRDATRDIEVSEAVRAPASLASAQAQEALLRMQLHLRGYLVLSDPADIEQYDAARAAFEKALASLQRLTDGWEKDERGRVQVLTEGYARWKLLPPKLFQLHEDTLRNRPALKLSRIDVQAQRVRALAEIEALIGLQKARPGDEVNRESLAAMLSFRSSLDALVINVMAFGASGENNFRLNYGPQLVANASDWDALNARRPWLTAAQRVHLDQVAAARAAFTDLALQVRAIMDGDRASEDLYLYRTEVVPQAHVLLDLLQQITVKQQLDLQAGLARARDSLARSRAQTVAGGLAAIAFGVAMAFLLRRSIVGPVQRLTEVAGRIAGGDLGARAHAEVHDEIGMLASSFNTMTARLAETIANLEAAYGEAHQARTVAESASRAKSGFLANMSHELRTPLNAILGYAQILRGNPDLDPRHAAGLATIQRSGEHLLLLINDMLDLARIEAGKVELYVEDMDLRGLLRTVTDIASVEVQRKELHLDHEVVGDLPSAVRADEKRLRQVLLNLLNNAVKFTQRGRVALRVTVLPAEAGCARLRFEVEDTGIGIEPEQLARLFRPFEQAADVQRRFGGAGLGLAISAQLLGLMGSEIRVESHVGSGSRFWFDLALPLAGQRHATQVPAIADVTGYDGPRRTVLVVDDIEANRAPLVHFLGGLGFQVREAENGEVAVHSVQAHRPDLVLMDRVMPVMDGAEAIRRLRGMADLRELPIVVVSANASAADQQESLALGANGFLPKPVDFGRLLPEIERLLGLTWQRNAAEAPADGIPATPAPLVAPPPAELDTLLRLARIGNMRSMRAHAEHLAVSDPACRPLAARLCRLADDFESAAIVELLASLRGGAERGSSPERGATGPAERESAARS
jgi:signal transduction histidine kinase/DNA-binding NarL/FixJ family response regulator